jgi:hypothetical protein
MLKWAECVAPIENIKICTQFWIENLKGWVSLGDLGIDGGNNIKWSTGCGLDSAGARWVQIAGFCDHRGESSGFIKVGNVLTR